jgi:glycosyltransferase involved in cell wall biosynthesis
MKILWLTPKWPLPADDGQKRATMALLELTAAKHEVTLAAFGDGPEVPGVRHSLPLMARGLRLGDFAGLFAGLPITMRRFALGMDTSGFDLVVFDTLHVAAAVSQLPPRYVYRAHNVESELWARAAERKGALGPLFTTQARRVRDFERRVIAGADTVFPVSEDDLIKLRAIEPGGRFECIPIGTRFSEPPARRGDYFLFIGRLDWAPNREGLEWLLQKVWPTIRGQRLVIAGSGNGAWLERYRGLEGVGLRGRVDSVEPLYAGAKALLIPVFFGSGTRVKAIEAASLAVPVISTEIGVEGLGYVPGEHYLRAETEAEWAAALASYRDPGHGARSRALLLPKFELNQVAERFLRTATAHQRPVCLP